MRGLRIFETSRARSLRADASRAEAALWTKLRNRQINGYKFSRQVVIGPYFADFCCREHKLVVEIDGATHSTDVELAADKRRSSFLFAEGYRVLRFTNTEVFENRDGVLETIVAKLEGREHL
ncbi:MAG: endonuclease domain-containing protein [Beijerinckiaceae bacterium]